MKIYEKDGTVFIVKGTKNVQIDDMTFQINTANAYMTPTNMNWDSYNLIADLPVYKRGDKIEFKKIVPHRGLVIKDEEGFVFGYQMNSWRNFYGVEVVFDGEEVVTILDM